MALSEPWWPHLSPVPVAAFRCPRNFGTRQTAFSAGRPGGALAFTGYRLFCFCFLCRMDSFAPVFQKDSNKISNVAMPPIRSRMAGLIYVTHESMTRSLMKILF